MIRLFVAIPIPDDIGHGLARRQQGLAGAHWRPLESLHLTLRFFGAISEDRADDVDAELAAVGGAAFNLALAGVGEFGAGGESHAVWAGVEDSQALRRLAARCESAARRAGLAPETRVWRPQITLAYLSGAEPARVAAWVQGHNLLKSPSFHVDAFGLYSSWRADRGHTYRLERRYSLARAAA
jgi:2'-5' RNA ligase